MTVTKDATAAAYYPQSGAEWTSLRGAVGPGNPAHAWNFSQASGNSADLIGTGGSVSLVITGPFAGPAFHQSIGGVTTLGVLFHNGNDDTASSNDALLPDVSATSAMLVLWSSIPIVNRGLANLGLRGHSPQQSASASPTNSGGNHFFDLTTHAGSANTTDADGGFHVVVLQVNRATSLATLTTDTAQVTCPYDGSLQGKEVCIGASDFSAGSGVAGGTIAIYAALFTGTNAEWSLGDISTLVGLLINGPNAIVTASGTSAGTSTAAAVGASVSPSSIDVEPTTSSPTVGDVVSLTATEVFTDLTTISRTSVATWATSNAKIATVSQGKVTTLSPGEVTISATYAGLTGKAIVTVHPVILGLDFEKTLLPLLTLAERRPGG